MLRELSLFSGAGGGLLGTTHLLGWHCVGYVEWDDYCQRVLKARIKDGYLHNAPIFGDIRAFIDEGYAESYQGMVDVITAGFPCQPFSVEGKRLEGKDNRNMWPETIEVIRHVTPDHVLLENVRGISKYLPVVVRDLRRAGYIVEDPEVVSAASAGALHIRERIWIYSHADRNGWERIGNKQSSPAWTWAQTWPEFEGLVQDVLQFSVPASKGSGIHDGVAHRVDRLKALGNGQVPAVVATAWQLLTGE